MSLHTLHALEGAYIRIFPSAIAEGRNPSLGEGKKTESIEVWPIRETEKLGSYACECPNCWSIRTRTLLKVILVAMIRAGVESSRLHNVTTIACIHMLRVLMRSNATHSMSWLGRLPGRAGKQWKRRSAPVPAGHGRLDRPRKAHPLSSPPQSGRLRKQSPEIACVEEGRERERFVHE